MKGIPLEICTHHRYTEDIKHVRQPQRRLNPALKDIVKTEIEKLLQVGFIYPISDSQWVSPLVIVPKKNGKWRVCIDYREINKATKGTTFPYHSLTKYWTTLLGESIFFSRWVQWV